MELDQEEKELEMELNVLGVKILKKQVIGEITDCLHTRIWALKDRVDEIRRICKDTNVSR